MHLILFGGGFNLVCLKKGNYLWVRGREKSLQSELGARFLNTIHSRVHKIHEPAVKWCGCLHLKGTTQAHRPIIPSTRPIALSVSAPDIGLRSPSPGHQGAPPSSQGQGARVAWEGRLPVGRRGEGDGAAAQGGIVRSAAGDRAAGNARGKCA